jgi:uncharacterized membrane protein YbhN (UPF0104 family)
MQKYRNRLLIGVGLVLVIYVGVLLIFDNQGQLTTGVTEALQKFPLWLIVPLILTQIVVATSRFMVWQYYLGVVGARDKITRFESAIISLSGNVMVMSPGKAAELLKAVLVKIKTGVAITRTAPIIIAERVVDGISVIIILTISLLLLNQSLALGNYLQISRTIVFSTAALLVVGLLVIQIVPLAHFFLNLLKHIPLLKRLHRPLVEFYESSQEIFNLKHLSQAVLRGVGVYISSSIGFILILWGFGLELTPTLILQAVFINGVTAAIGALSFVPNGAGVSEISTLAMLNIIVAPANPILTPGAAAAAALMQGFFHKWFRVLIGLTVALIYRNWLFTPVLEAELMAAEQHPPTADYNLEITQA